MKKRMKPVEAWAVVDEDGGIVEVQLSMTEADSVVSEFCGERVVRVLITQAEGEV